MQGVISSFTKGQGFRLHLLWSALLFGITKILIGNYYEVYEFIFPLMFSGKLMDDVPGYVFYPIAHLGVEKLYVKLYELSPNVPWYDLMMGSYFVFSVAVFFKAFENSSKGKLKPWSIILFNTVIFFLFISESILNWNYTRTSFMVCIAAFVWVESQKIIPGFSKTNIWFLVSAGLLFALGVLIRPEAGTLMFILSSGFFICTKGFKKETALKILPFFIPTIIISGSVMFNRLTSEEFYSQLDPVTEYQIRLGNVVSISEMKNAEDSMKYIALREGLVNDPAYINLDFVERVIGGRNIFLFSHQLFNRAKYLLKETLANYILIIGLNIILMASGLWFFRRNKLKLLRFVVFNGLFWLLLFSIAYLMTMENRLIAPLLFFYFVALIHFLPNDKLLSYWSRNAVSKAIVIVPITGLLAISLYYQVSEGKNYLRNVTLNRKNFQKLEQASVGKILVTDAAATMIILYNNFLPFQNPVFKKANKILFIDIETLTLTEPYRKFLDRNCNCNSMNLRELFDYFYSNKKEILLAGNPKRIKLFESYLRIVHHKQFNLQEACRLGNNPEASENQNNSISIFSFQ